MRTLLARPNTNNPGDNRVYLEEISRTPAAATAQPPAPAAATPVPAPNNRRPRNPFLPDPAAAQSTPAQARATDNEQREVTGQDECTICFNKFCENSGENTNDAGKAAMLTCGHTLHYKCYEELKNTPNAKCPECRAALKLLVKTTLR